MLGLRPPPAPREACAGPFECRLQTQSTGLADLFAVLPGLVRVNGVTVTFGQDSVQEVVRMLNSLSAMSVMLR